MRTSCRWLLIAFLIAFVLGADSAAQLVPPVYRVFAEFGHGGCHANPEFDISGSSSVQGSSGVLPCEFGSGQVSSQAGPGLLVSSVAIAHTGFGTSTDMETQSEFTVPFMLASNGATHASIALNLELTANLVSSHAGIGWNIVVTAFLDGAPFAMGRRGASGATGFLVPFPDGPPQAFNTNGVVVTTNTPHTLGLALTVSAGTNTFGAGVSLENTTVTFATQGPAFVLPDGVTLVDNPHLGIAGNRWIDPRRPPTFHTVLDPDARYQHTVPGFDHTGFSIHNIHQSPVSLTGETSYDPDAGLQPGDTAQEGFLLLDGTLALAVAATHADGSRARMLTTYRFDVARRSLRRDSIARALVRQGVIRDLPRARTRARAMRLEDARVMRLVEGRDGSPSRWMRAVRTLGDPRILRFRPRQEPDGVLGHFGTTVSDTGDAFVWAVLDRNSRYAVGLTVDRDDDGVPNASDNCVGTQNSNQSDADGDNAGDACDLDDDNDDHADENDNCPLTANAEQLDLDGDGLGDACDLDDDNDAVADGADHCLATQAGELVDASGCSIADRCPCDGGWRNHGAYVRCVAQASGLFVNAGLISSTQKSAITSAAAQSACGF
jgi:hypothetical protein